jgi:short-subunit dehydrogenase
MQSKGKTVLVTGASSGIGLLVANKLHENGYQVIGTSRSPEKHQAFHSIVWQAAVQPDQNFRCADQQRRLLSKRTCRGNPY